MSANNKTGEPVTVSHEAWLEAVKPHRRLDSYTVLLEVIRLVEPLPADDRKRILRAALALLE